MSRRVPLWEAINRYARTCGGDTSASTAHGNTARMQAVVDIERLVDEEARERRSASTRHWGALFKAARAVVNSPSDRTWDALRAAFENVRGGE